jgi:hypothetical protein
MGSLQSYGSLALAALAAIERCAGFRALDSIPCRNILAYTNGGG